jgi:ketosteroid isomerase-like protein
MVSKDVIGAMADRQSQQTISIKEIEEMGSTKDVIGKHLSSFGKRDLEGILSDYAPGAILFTRDGTLRNIDEIKEFFQVLLAEFGKPGATFSLKHQSVEGDYGYILWTAETANNVYELGTDTFVVREGKIIVQSFAGKITPKR